MTAGTESIITPDGHKRILNLEPSPPELLRLVRGPLQSIPLNEIRDFDLWPGVVQIKNQGSYGACNGHASATAVEFARAMNGHYVPLSAWWVYGRLVMGRDRGSNILQALDLIQREGVAPEPLVKYGDFSGRYNAETTEAAKRFKAEVTGRLETWEEIVTAVALRRGVNLSVRATNGWDGRLDANGCPPVGRGPGNHAVMVGGGIKTIGGQKYIRMANSWSTKWGDKGFCWLSRDHWESGTWREAFEVEAVIRDPQDEGVKA